VDTQGGDRLCQIACNTSISIQQIKAKVEVEAGLKAATLAIYLPEVTQPLGQDITLAGCGLPSILYALILHKITIADMLGFSPELLTDVQLAKACSTDEGKSGDIVGLAGCAAIRDVSCLVWLEQMQELDISGCTGIDATTVARVVAENRSLTKLIFGAPGADSESESDSEQECKWEPAVLEAGMTEAGFSNKNLGVGGAIIVSAWLTHKNNRALTKLILRDNSLANEQGGKVLSTMLTTNSTLTELDVSDNWKGAGSGGPAKFAKELAVGLCDNGAMSRFTFSGDRYDSKPVTMETSMVEADFSGKVLGASGAIMVAAFLPKCM
jgi:hypothetical protein